jgi:hypothetical protein
LLFSFSVSYQTTAAQLRVIGARVKAIIEACKLTRFDRANWITFSDPGLVFECVFYVLDNNYNLALDIQEKIYLGIYEMLEEQGVVLAYGTQFRWAPPSLENEPQLAGSGQPFHPEASH